MPLGRSQPREAISARPHQSRMSGRDLWDEAVQLVLFQAARQGQYHGRRYPAHDAKRRSLGLEKLVTLEGGMASG
ncbi:hypothetical protein VTI74DRAFT_2255 [Chaetomium olivicolor]